jgi:hypothetical protein
MASVLGYDPGQHISEIKIMRLPCGSRQMLNVIGKTGNSGKQPGAPGSYLAWREDPDRTVPHFPRGACGCGANLAGAADLGWPPRTRSWRSRRWPRRSSSMTCTQWPARAGGYIRLLRLREPGCPGRIFPTGDPYVRRAEFGDAGLITYLMHDAASKVLIRDHRRNPALPATSATRVPPPRGSTGRSALRYPASRRATRHHQVILPGGRKWIRTSDPSLVRRSLAVAGRRLMSA